MIYSPNQKNKRADRSFRPCQLVHDANLFILKKSIGCDTNRPILIINLQLLFFFVILHDVDRVETLISVAVVHLERTRKINSLIIRTQRYFAFRGNLEGRNINIGRSKRVCGARINAKHL